MQKLIASRRVVNAESATRFFGAEASAPRNAGPAIAVPSSMVAQHFTELDAWRLADQLATFVTRLIGRTVWTDRELVSQINRSSARAPSNIAEGFGRFGPGSFGYFLNVAVGSEFETRDHLIRAARRGYITEADRDEGVVLVKRASTAAIRLRRYVLSPEGRANAKRIEQRLQSKGSAKR